MVLVALVVAAMIFLFVAMRGEDDIAGGVAMGLFVTLIFVIVASAAAVFERMLQSALDRKAEH